MGEVAVFSEADQFQAGKSQFECGFFTVAFALSAAKAGHSPALTQQQIIANAEKWYAAAYGGDNSISNVYGMTDDMLYALLREVGLHYQASPLDGQQAQSCEAWLKLGYPVIVSVQEASVFDEALGANPYPWNATGGHYFLLVGLDGANFLVRDPANCTNLFDPNSLRPGPRTYRIAGLQITSVVGIVLPWLARPQAGFDPRKDKIVAVPEGWHYDEGKNILTAPNGIQVVEGFAKLIVGQAWNKDNTPIDSARGVNPVEKSNPSLGEGVIQDFREGRLCWTKKNNQSYVSWVGQELVYNEKENAQLLSEVQSLKDQLAKLPAPGSAVGGVSIDQSKLNAALSAVAPLAALVDFLKGLQG